MHIRVPLLCPTFNAQVGLHEKDTIKVLQVPPSIPAPLWTTSNLGGGTAASHGSSPTVTEMPPTSHQATEVTAYFVADRQEEQEAEEEKQLPHLTNSR